LSSEPSPSVEEGVQTAALRVAVAVPGPFAGPLSYSLPESLVGELRRGHAVLVPLGRRRVTGWVTAVDPPVPDGVKLKAVAELLAVEPVLRESDLLLAERLSSYYMHPLGEVLKTALPSAERTETRARWVLTEAGAERLKELKLSSNPGDDDAGRLAALTAAKGKGKRRATLISFLRHSGVASPPALIRQLEGEGLIKHSQVVDRKRRMQPVGESWLRLGVPLDQAIAAFARKGLVRDRLLLHLARRKWVPRKELVDQFPGAARILKQLDEKGLIESEQRLPQGIGGDDAAASMSPERPEPNPAQEAAVEAVLPYVIEPRFGVFALEGVTGSGKTEVYLRLAEQALESGGGVLVLVPEIALTPQLEQRFRSRLGEDLVLLHSGRTPAERHDAYQMLRQGRARTALGVRSAVFAPVHGLRLIVVDEEHDDSYKQDDGLRYNARDAAVLRAHIEGVPCILGSATLSLESWANVQDGRYRHLMLPDRVAGRPMPQVERVLLSGVSTSDSEAGRWLTDRLLEELGRTLDMGEQAIVLLNRRGFATYIVCGRCGSPFYCPDCDTSLVYHARSDRLRCHLCGWWRERPDTCPSCGADEVVMAGRGTERIEDEIAARFPKARIDRMDRDTTRRRGSHAEILERFRRREVDLLIGTQMLAKGHDMPGVTLVGVVHADAGLGLPDFRAPERTFQLLTQVAGRAGRGDRPGRVIFQAMRPDHVVIKAAAAQDAGGFREYELARRRMAMWPPFSRLALLRLDAQDQNILREKAGDLARDLRRVAPKGARLLGPIPPLAPRMAGRYRLQILLRCQERPVLRKWLLATDAWKTGRRGPVRISLDIDPIRLT